MVNFLLRKKKNIVNTSNGHQPQYGTGVESRVGRQTAYLSTSRRKMFLINYYFANKSETKVIRCHSLLHKQELKKLHSQLLFNNSYPSCHWTAYFTGKAQVIRDDKITCNTSTCSLQIITEKKEVVFKLFVPVKEVTREEVAKYINQHCPTLPHMSRQ